MYFLSFVRKNKNELHTNFFTFSDMTNSNTEDNFFNFRSTPTYLSNVDNNAFVISFLGDTAGGKSFLAKNELLGAESFVFDEDKHAGSTTANVMCFESSSIFKPEQNMNCLALDFEGENGISSPRIVKRMVDHVQAKSRRDAVGKYFPKLA
jgi:hypothetical protein